jgi:hypothetical protein
MLAPVLHRIVLGVVAGAALVAIGCTSSMVSPNPPPTLPTAPPGVPEVPGATRGASEGSTGIRLTAADPAPGATLSGCGGGASGCTGRIRMTFQLASPVGGPALGLLAHLHSDRATACYVATAPSFTLVRGMPHDVEVVFEPDDTDAACPTPLDLTHLAVVVEGTVEVFARQEWALRYRLVP